MKNKDLKERRKLHKKAIKSLGESTESLDNLFSYDKLYNLQQVKSAWKNYLDKKNKEDVLDLYIHIPFCRSKCSYCMYPSWTYKNSNQLNKYVDYITKEINFFKDVFTDILFSNLYIGGGTPSILNKDQLEKLLFNLFNNFSFKEDGEKTFEANPESLSLEKLDIINKFNLNRISIGVQSTNCQVLNKHNRGYQDIDKINEIIKRSKNIVDEINVDLIANLHGSDPNSFRKSFSDIAKLKPSTIVVYALHPTKEYSREYLDINLDQYYENYPEQISPFIKVMKEEKEKFQYINFEPLNSSRFSWGFKRKDYKRKLKGDYSGEFSGDSSCLGLGFFSRSHIANNAEYVHKKLDYNLKPKENIFHGRSFTKREEMISYIIESLNKNNSVNLEEFKNKFNSSLEDNFEDELDYLKKVDQIKFKENEIRLLASSQKEKFINYLYFFEEEKVKRMNSKSNKRIDRKKVDDKNNSKKQWVRLTRKCNNDCLFCLDRNAQNGTSISFEDIIKDLKEGIKRGASQVVLSGGEPTIHPRFLEIVEKAKKMDYDHVQVISNGRMFAYADFLKKAINAGVDEITFSFHGHTPKLHDRQTGIKGSFKQALKGLTNALDTNLIISVDIVINKLSYKHLYETLNYFIFLGVRDFDLLQVIPFGSAWDNKEKMFYDLDKAKPFLEKAFKLSKRKNIHISTNRFPPQYLEGFEDIIQDPDKLLDEVRGREEMFNEFLEKGKKMRCFGEKCKYCFLENFCKDLIKFKKEGVLFSKSYPICLSRLNQQKVNLIDEKNADIFDFLDFYIQHRYFEKSLRCKDCKYYKDCSGMHIKYLIENGFKTLKPIKNG